MATFWAKIRYQNIVSELDFFKNQTINYSSLVSMRKIDLLKAKCLGRSPEDEYGTVYVPIHDVLTGRYVMYGEIYCTVF